jgi:hypothetical protein
MWDSFRVLHEYPGIVATRFPWRIDSACVQEALRAQVDRMSNQMTDIHTVIARNSAVIAAHTKELSEFQARLGGMAEAMRSAKDNEGGGTEKE